MRSGEDTREMILADLAGKRGKEARAIIQEWHERTGLSLGAIYNISHAARGTGRAPRKDAGSRRSPISDAQIQAVQSLITKYNMAAWHAIKTAEDNGILPAGALSVARLNAHLAAHHQSRARLNTDVKPARRFEAEGPNVLHHFDTTKLEELHLSTDGIVTYDHAANRKNSRGEKPDPIWLYSLVDDFSRCKFALLFRGLNQFNHLDFFYAAWAQKETPTEFPFFGAPRHLYMDCGGGNQSLKVKTALKKLGVHVIPTTPSTWEPQGARKHGKVERAFQDYDEWKKSFQARPHTWEEAQASLYQFLLHLNRRVHRSTGKAPFQRWLAIGKPQQMPDAEIYRILYFDHIQRTVTRYLTVSIDNHTYRLPWRRPYIDWVDAEVQVYWEPGHFETVFVVYGTHEVELHELAEVITPAFSYPRTQRAPTAVELARADAAQYDHSGLRLWAQTEVQTKTAYLPKKGAQFDDTKIAAKTIVTAEGKQRPSHAPMRYIGHIEVTLELLDDFDDTDARNTFVTALMAGREKISEDDLTLAQARLRAQRATGTEG